MVSIDAQNTAFDLLIDFAIKESVECRLDRAEHGPIDKDDAVRPVLAQQQFDVIVGWDSGTVGVDVLMLVEDGEESVKQQVGGPQREAEEIGGLE